MPARSPQEVHLLYADYFSAGDLDGLMSLYEAGAAFVRGNGDVVNGHAEIRATLANILPSKGRMELQVRKAVRAGDLALLLSDWIIHEESSDESGNSSGRTSDVVRRQQDGNWLIVIDNPHGGDSLDD
ncbi:MAG: YybH family protein [Pyrinomonadaceae bacterium]